MREGEDNLKMMLALAWGAVSESPELIPEVREGILTLGDLNFITAQDSPLESSTALITYQDETTVPILQDENLNERSYSRLISVALSVLEDVINLPERSGEEEERRRASAAAKVLPELLNIRSEEKGRVSKELSKFYPKMKEILSKERNKEVKEELEQNNSIPSDVRKKLRLKLTSDDIV